MMIHTIYIMYNSNLEILNELESDDIDIDIEILNIHIKINNSLNL